MTRPTRTSPTASEWTGSAKINVLGSNETLPTRLLLTVTDGSDPVALMNPAGLGLDSQIGGLVLVDTNPTFSVNLVFEAFRSGTWTPAKDLFDSLSTNPGAMVQDDFSGGFWYAVNPAVQLSTPSLSFGRRRASARPAAPGGHRHQQRERRSQKSCRRSPGQRRRLRDRVEHVHLDGVRGRLLRDRRFVQPKRNGIADGVARHRQQRDQQSGSGQPERRRDGGRIDRLHRSGVDRLRLAADQDLVGVPFRRRHQHGRAARARRQPRCQRQRGVRVQAREATCTAAPIAPGDSCTVLVRFVPPSIGARTATLTIGDDATGGPHAVPLSGAGVASADLDVDVADSPSPVLSGSPLTWSIVVTNNGPSAARDVVLTDVLPADVRVVSISATGLTCHGPRAGATGTVTCTVKTIKKHTTREVDIVVSVQTPSGGHVSDTASVTESTGDPVAANNSATASTAVL